MISPKPEIPEDASQPRLPEQPKDGVSCLRLSSILIGLRAQADLRAAAGPGPAEAGHGKRPRRRKRTPSNLTLGDIIDQTAHAGFGFLTAFLALVAIPLAGVSLPFGSAIAFLGAEMIAGKNRPWLPKRLRRHVVAMSTLNWLSQRVTRWTRGMERWIKPRYTFLAGGPMWGLIGAGLIIQGVGLALPIPIPASNQIFIIPILAYAIGMLEDDGLLILIGHMATSIMVVLGVVFSEKVYESLHQCYVWVAAFF
jgi:hypothetical protein